MCHQIIETLDITELNSRMRDSLLRSSMYSEFDGLLADVLNVEISTKVCTYRFSRCILQ